MSDTEEIPALEEDTVELKGYGPVVVRGMSRYEAAMSRTGNPDQFTSEKRILHFGMVSPTRTEEQAAKWLRGFSWGALEPVLLRIAELSGLVEGADKSRVPAAGEQPGSGV